MGPPVKFGEFVEHARDAVSFCFIIAQGRSPPRGDIGPSYAGTVTTLGSSAFRKFVPDQDSEMVVRLRQAGLVILGKTHTPEFGLSTSSESRLFGATHNPWNLEYSAGGSSGGSAAAIASAMVPMAYANDSGGSIRIPASCLGCSA